MIPIPFDIEKCDMAIGTRIGARNLPNFKNHKSTIFLYKIHIIIHGNVHTILQLQEDNIVS